MIYWNLLVIFLLHIREGRLQEQSSFKTVKETRKPGNWATPPPESGINLGYVPVQTYVSVRRSNSVKRLPRSEAYKESTSPDELVNAHRLREVLRTKKIQEVYSEEGYEDSAYDHGSQQRFAEYDESLQKHQNGSHHQHETNDSDKAGSETFPEIKKPLKKPLVYRKKVEVNKVSFSYDKKNDPNGKAEGSKTFSHQKVFSRKGDFWDYIPKFDNWSVDKWSDDQNLKKKKSLFQNFNDIDAMPTFKYIHSLTDAHYGHQTNFPSLQPKAIPTHLIGLTKGLSEEKFAPFEAKRTSKRVKRDTDSTQYEKQLSSILDQQQKKVVGTVTENLKLPEEIPTSILPPVAPQNQLSGYDNHKYPFYSSLSANLSPLKYAVHPRHFPLKTGYGMEFYDSRDRLIQCENINVTLENVPKENSTEGLVEQPGSKKRIVHLGEKIRCMKIKYFGEDPLDNPFFREIEKSLVPTINNNDSSSESSRNEVNYEIYHPDDLNAIKNNSSSRVIPVTEASLPEITTSLPIRGMLPPPVGIPYLPLSIINLPRVMRPKKLMTKVKYKYNCLHPVTKLTVSERSDTDEDVMFDCRDVVLIKTVRDGNKHFRIIPKKVKRSHFTEMVESSVRAGEISKIHKRRKRSTPTDTTKRRTSLFPNKAFLDRMIGRPPQRARNTTSVNNSTAPTGLKTALPTSPTIVTRNRAKIISTTTSRPHTTDPVPRTSSIPKKPPVKLRGLDFLTRYQKTKNLKANGDVNEFWKIQPSVVPPNERTSELHKRGTSDFEDVQVSIGNPFVKRSERAMRRSWLLNKVPDLLYVVDTDSGLGKWVAQL